LKSATAKYPVSVLAAVAAAWALDVPPELLAAGLRTFDATPKQSTH
jgi:cyanophycin synthetase